MPMSKPNPPRLQPGLSIVSPFRVGLCAGNGLFCLEPTRFTTIILIISNYRSFSVPYKNFYFQISVTGFLITISIYISDNLQNG
jgi:hypothetical protein